MIVPLGGNNSEEIISTPMDPPGPTELDDRDNRDFTQAAVSETILNDLARHLGSEWTHLASELNFRLNEVEQFKADNRSTRDRIVKMLITWCQRWDPAEDCECAEALDRLSFALKNIGRTDLAHNIRGLQHGNVPFDLNRCRNEFAGYYKNAMGVIPLLPWFPCEVNKTDDIYVQLNLRERENTVSRVAHGQICSYEDLLRLKFHDDTPVRHIMVSGIAGSGKTTIVSKIALDWAQGRPDSPLSEFRLLVALSMRELKGFTDLSEAVFDQILSKDTPLRRDSMRRYMETHPEKILVLLDGVDEFDKEGSQLPACGDFLDIMSNKILRGCTVIVTTRPHMIDKLCRLNPCFTHIESKGFSNDGVKEYIEKFFKDQDRAMYSGFYQVIAASQSLHNLARIPMMLMLMCLVWSDGHRLPETLTELFKEAFFFMLRRQLDHQPDELDFESEESGQRVFQELVQGLGKAALDGLMLPGQKLVFETKMFKNPKMVGEACKIGILSQERVRSKCRTVSTVTFLHKTVQEAIAGMYWASLVASDTESFDQNLRQVNAENAFSLEYLLRFCCGANTEAARSILAHIAKTFSWEGAHDWKSVDYKNYSLEEFKGRMLLAPEKERLKRRLWLLLHLEAQSKDLHTLAGSVFRDGVTFNFQHASEDERLAFIYLINSATGPSVSQSFLDEIKHVSVCGISNKASIDPLVRLLRQARNLTSVRLLFNYDVKDSEGQSALGEALGNLSSLESLSLLNDNISTTLDLSSAFESMNRSWVGGSLQILGLRWVCVESTYLRSFLEKQSTLCQFAVHGSRFVGHDEFKFWSEASQGLQTQSLQVLEVSGISTGPHARYLGKSYPRLQDLRLPANALTEEDFRLLGCPFSEASRLRMVDVSGNNGGAAFTSLVEQFPKLDKVEVLRMSDMELDTEQVIRLTTDVLPLLTTLQTLSLSHYVYTPLSIAPRAVVAVLRWSCTSSSLKQLDIKQCSRQSQTDHPSDIVIVETVEESLQSSIENIDFSSNVLGKCTPHSIELFKHMPLLKTIDMSSLHLTGADAEVLAGAVTGCKQLQKLHLGDNDDMGVRGLEALLKMLPKLPQLEHLSLPDVPEQPTDLIQECFSHGKRYIIIVYFYEFDRSQIKAVVDVVKRLNKPCLAKTQQLL